MPGSGDLRVWTITKTASSLHLLCNGVQIFDLDFAEWSSPDEECVKKWSMDFAYLRFTSTFKKSDEASDFFRQLSYGEPFS